MQEKLQDLARNEAIVFAIFSRKGCKSKYSRALTRKLPLILNFNHKLLIEPSQKNSVFSLYKNIVFLELLNAIKTKDILHDKNLKENLQKPYGFYMVGS